MRNVAGHSVISGTGCEIPRPEAFRNAQRLFAEFRCPSPKRPRWKFSHAPVVLLLATALTTLGQTGRISGTVKDDSGAPIAGASVMAALRSAVPPGTPGPKGAPLFLPFPPVAASTATGDFEIDNLPAGTYALCVEKPESALLNPCLWAAPAMVSIAAGATATKVAVTAPRGVILTVRVQDPKGTLSTNPAADDLQIGTSNAKTSFIPARVSGRDATGRNMAVLVPRGQAAKVLVSSANFTLSDGAGNALGTAQTQVPVDSATVTKADAPSGAPTPVFTVQVTGKK